MESEDARTENENTPAPEGKAKKARAPRKPKTEAKPKARRATKPKAAKPKKATKPKAKPVKTKAKGSKPKPKKGGKRHPETGIDYSAREMPKRLKPKGDKERPDTNVTLLKLCSKKAYSVGMLIESGKFEFVRDSGVAQAVKRLYISGDLELGTETIPPPSGRGRAAFTYRTTKQGLKRLA